MTTANTDDDRSGPLLAVRGLGRRFGAAWPLRGLTFERDAPGVVGLVGANGSGKTTLLRIVAQLLEPSEGSVTLLGRRVPHGGSATARRHIGFASHEPFAWRADSVHRNLAYAARLAGAGRDTVARAASAWRLDAVLDSPVHELSRGWQQRFACARADLIEPTVLLLDEPTVGLDAPGRALLDDALDRWRASRLVMLASHDRDWLAAHADETIDLDLAARP